MGPEQTLQPLQHGCVVGASTAQKIFAPLPGFDSKRLLENGFFLTHPKLRNNALILPEASDLSD
jgi:hypothetical protein